VPFLCTRFVNFPRTWAVYASLPCSYNFGPQQFLKELGRAVILISATPPLGDKKDPIG